MSARTKITIAAIAAVIILDTGASLISRLTNIPYKDFSIGSVLISLAIGFFVSRSSLDSNPMQAISAAGIVAFVDATLGWWISYAIGPGRPSHPLTPSLWIFTLSVVILNGTFCASIGYFAESRWLYRLRR